jgi:hypothetical protein
LSWVLFVESTVLPLYRITILWYHARVPFRAVCGLIVSFGPLLIYTSHEGVFFSNATTQQGQDICFVERWTESGSLWFSEGSSLAHRRIAKSIKECPWVASGSPRGAEGEHPWIVCLRKPIKNPPRYGCRALYDMGKRRRLIHVRARLPRRKIAAAVSARVHSP